MRLCVCGFFFFWISSRSRHCFADPLVILFHGSSVCLSCCVKHDLTASSEGLQKGKRIVHQDPTETLPSVSNEFWTTSTRDMDNSVLSQGSVSSISTSVQALETHAGTGCSNPPPEFVNHGLLLWNQIRQHWVAKKKPSNGMQQSHEPKLSWNASYESLLVSNKPFPQPVPLYEMVEFLVDVWEQGGMYD